MDPDHYAIAEYLAGFLSPPVPGLVDKVEAWRAAWPSPSSETLRAHQMEARSFLGTVAIMWGECDDLRSYWHPGPPQEEEIEPLAQSMGLLWAGISLYERSCGDFRRRRWRAAV